MTREKMLEKAKEFYKREIDPSEPIPDEMMCRYMRDFALEQLSAQQDWTVIDGPETLPQWPKNYLWQWTNAKGKVFHKVQYFPVTHSREWFASVYEAWQPIEPYSPQEAVVKESLTTETL